MSQPSILVIEDEQDTVLFLKDRLEMAGYRVVIANNGVDGLKKAQNPEDLPDVVLLDVMLPQMNGFQVCRKIREDPATKSLPVIMMTAKAQDSDRTMGKDCGCDEYLTKPFETEELLATISRYLTKH